MKMFSDKYVLLMKKSSRNSKMAGIGQESRKVELLEESSVKADSVGPRRMTCTVHLEIGMGKAEFRCCYKRKYSSPLIVRLIQEQVLAPSECRLTSFCSLICY